MRHPASLHPPSVASTARAAGAGRLLEDPAHLAVRIPGAVPGERCRLWADAVAAARGDWTADFDGEQFTLGRAFYTHLETGRAREYFAAAARSDALVERHAAGLQEAMRALAGETVGARVAQRPGWCGAGVHVFLPDGPVARDGGVVHFDTEGLTEGQIARRAPALSIVLMLQPPEQGGGLRLWPALYDGDDAPPPSAADEGSGVVVHYEAGDAVVFDSYRCHQIQPFGGDRPRISATVHVVEIARGLWECWF